LQRLSSLSTRLVVAVVATASVAFTVSVGLTIWRLNQGLDRQASQLARLSEAKLGQELDGQARLAGARVQALFANSGRRLENIAQRADVVKAVSTGNSITMSELLGRAARSADLDGILVVDTKLRALGADKEASNAGLPGGAEVVDILATSQALAAHPLAQQIKPLLVDNDRRRPAVLRRILALDERLAGALGTRMTAPLAVVAVEPIFDDFGDVFAALIAHRALRPQEGVLEDFSKLEGAGLLVLEGDRAISSAGIAGGMPSVTGVPGSLLLRTNDRAFWSRCTDLFDYWRMCSLAPVTELHALRDELVRIGEMEGRSLTTWLSLFALFSLVLFAAIMLLMARRVSRPLAQITEAVRAVARGDWKSEVVGIGRKDEVGDIARAVVVLQRSLEERDRLRVDVAQAENIKRRREELEDAIRRFDRVMRSVLLSVSDCVETMDETARELARMSAVAEGEAAEAAFVSESTVSNVSALRAATERLSASISETADHIRQTADILSSGSRVAQSASSVAEHFASKTREVNDVVRLIDELAAQTNVVALNATIHASRAGNGDGNFGAVVTDIKDLAARIGRANDDIARQMSSVCGAGDDAVEPVRAVAQKMELVLQQTKVIALAMERQDAVTREIATSMSVAANGTVNVSSSVDRLKTTIEEARGASMKVVAKATAMADEAHRLDSTVKSFLREVTA
jgi:methyl-accepting chemotaxis protein